MSKLLLFVAIPLVSTTTAFFPTTLFAQEGSASTKSEEGYESNRAALEDPLKGEKSVTVRVANDSTRIADLIEDEDLSLAIGEALEQLFDPEEEDQDRLDVAKELKSKIGQLNRSDATQFSVVRQLDRRVAIAEAGIQALVTGPTTDEARELTNDFMIRAAIDFENSGRSAHANVVRTRYAALKQSYPHIYTKLKPVMANSFFNYNLHFVVSEPMLSRILSDFRTESGGIAECILGAWVTGSQNTDTSVRADIKPSLGSGMFNLVVDGRTISNTRGRKSPATVYTRGNIGFRVVKGAFFDGRSLTSGPADMTVNANNQTTGIRTDFDRIPILRGIVQSIARKEVAKKKAQSERIAADKAANQALPRIESEVATKFSEANFNLQEKVLGKLEAKGIAPQVFSARSSETHLAVSSRTIVGNGLSATIPPSTPAPMRGIAIQIHESSINAGIDSLKLDGRMPVQAIIHEIETNLKDITGRDVVLRPDTAAEDDKTEFDFAISDPIRVRFEEDEVVIILRTGFYQTDKERLIPRHKFEIPLKLELSGGQIVLTPPDTDAGGALSLRPQPIEGGRSLRGVAQARAVALELLKKTFKDPVTYLSSMVQIQLPDNGPLNLQITDFDISDGWLTVVFE